MKSFREELEFETKTRRAYLNITSQVETALKKSGIKEGLCLVNPMHISASVYINDDESGLLHDYDVFLERLVPHEPIEQYRHNDTGEDNADAHIKRQVMGREIVVAVTNGKLDFGPWEQIFSNSVRSEVPMNSRFGRPFDSAAPRKRNPDAYSTGTTGSFAETGRGSSTGSNRLRP